MACSDNATSQHATDQRCQQALRNAGQAIRSPLASPTKTDASTHSWTDPDDPDANVARPWLGVRIASLFKPPGLQAKPDEKTTGTEGNNRGERQGTNDGTKRQGERR